jgi:hypothetical protein
MMNRHVLRIAAVIAPLAMLSVAVGCTSLLGDFALGVGPPDSHGDAGPLDASHDTLGDVTESDTGDDATGDDGGDDSSVANPCANNVAPAQQFTSKMYGCAGKVTWDKRANLCQSLCVPCGAQRWVSGHGNTAPTHDYWTDDNLGYNGGGAGLCYAVLNGGNLCSGGGDGGSFNPFRVCLPAASFPDGGYTSLQDPEGNVCNWSDCGFNTQSPDEYFGGCAGNTTAGTLCCCP